jgi:HAD superfamily hydrolase (TIGR01509 family)
MNKALIFDLDGVIIDDEKIWEEKKEQLYRDFFGEEVSARLGPTSGVSMEGIYDLAVAAGARVDKQELLDAFFSLATTIYRTAPISQGLEELVAELRKLGYSIGIVSSSPMAWITAVTKRLPFENEIELIVSCYDRNDIRHKPAPDGYIEAMKAFEITPQNTVALEDSNTGIASAKASGAYTIGLRQNLIEGYEQKGADDYADSMADVIRLVSKRVASPS